MIPLYPRIVHLPVTLLITAAAFGILALIFTSQRIIFREVLIWNLALGVAGSIFSMKNISTVIPGMIKWIILKVFPPMRLKFCLIILNLHPAKLKIGVISMNMIMIRMNIKG